MKRSDFLMIKKLISIIVLMLLLAGCEGVSTMKQYDGKPEANCALESDFETFSEHIILLNLTDNEVIYCKSENQRTYPASLTKIMTVLVAIENMTEDTMVTIDDYTNLYQEGASLAGFLPNDQVSSIDLLYGTMLPSGAEAALSLAQNISGSEKEFVKLMNEKAQELGMEDTHFENVTGLHNRNHYTTVHDLSILLKEALKNPTFKQIFTAERYSTKGSKRDVAGMTFTSRLFSKLDSPYFEGGKILGGKTGYTPEAGLCLASVATNGEKEYILITTNAEGGPYTEQFNILDAINLYERFLNKE